MYITLQENNDSNDITYILQEAINSCHNNGGGTVIIPSGKKYVIGGIYLKSNVELHLQKNSILMGNGDEKSYIKRPGPFELFRNNTPISGLIYAKGEKNIKITGEGEINGNYSEFILPNQENEVHLKFYKYPRPMTIYMENCKDIFINEITIKDAPFWTIHLVGCIDTIIQNIKIFNEMRMPNTDGIDIDRCKNTLIKDCIIFTGDDAICPKCTEETAEYGDCINLFVENCHLISQSSAIKFGSSSFGNFINFKFRNLKIENSNRGLALQLRDTGNAENILFENISLTTQRYSANWWGAGEPIYVTVCRRDINTKIGNIINVTFRNINCETENGVFIYGEEKGSIKNIILDNIKLTFRRVTNYELNEYDLRPYYDEKNYIIRENISPCYAENIENLVLNDISIIDNENILSTTKYKIK